MAIASPLPVATSLSETSGEGVGYPPYDLQPSWQQLSLEAEENSSFAC